MSSADHVISSSGEDLVNQEEDDDLQEGYDDNGKALNKMKSALGKFGSQLKKATSASAEKADELKGKVSGMMKKKPEQKTPAPADIVPTENYHIFGAPLMRAVQVTRLDTQHEIPAIVQQCILFLNKKGLDEEGIYRVPGSTTRVNTLKAQFNAVMKLNLEEMGLDPYNVAGLLKLYFRELPEPLLTRDAAPLFNQALNIPNERERTMTVKSLLTKLPTCNQACLNWLMNHLLMVAEMSEVNKMPISNLGVVFSPCLDVPPLLFKIFLTDCKTLFPNPFVEAPPERPARTTSVKTETKAQPIAYSEHTEATNGEWDELESSLSEPVPPKVTPSPAAIANATPPRPPRSTAPPAATAAPVTTQAAPVAMPRTSSIAKKVEKEEPVIEKSAEEQLKELDLILGSISTDDLDSF